MKPFFKKLGYHSLWLLYFLVGFCAITLSFTGKQISPSPFSYAICGIVIGSPFFVTKWLITKLYYGRNAIKHIRAWIIVYIVLSVLYLIGAYGEVNYKGVQTDMMLVVVFNVCVIISLVKMLPSKTDKTIPLT
jgi:hypothetical protein